MKTDLSKRINVTTALLRIMLALALFPHGAQKMLGWYGGYGLDGTMKYFSGSLNLPYIVGLSVILIEFLSPFFLLLGIFSRITAASVFALFIGIVITHSDNGFFMNWFGNQAGEGYEYHLLILTISAAIMIIGPGKFTVGKLLRKSIV